MSNHMTAYERVLDARECKDGTMQVTLRFPHVGYVEEFWGLKCASDIMLREAIPNVKELTEAMGMFQKTKKYLHDTKENWIVFVVGDGSTPRLGTLIAFRTKWNVISIDPKLGGWENRLARYHTDRLYTFANTVEHFLECAYNSFMAWFSHPTAKRMWLLPHTHVDMEGFLKRIHPFSKHGDVLITNGCCVSLSVGIDYCYYFKHPGWMCVDDKDDWGVHSPKRRFQTYTFCEGFE